MSDASRHDEPETGTRIDCWNSIGVLGEGSCPQLATHVHCRNCPSYSVVAADFLDADLPDNYLQQSTAQVARQQSLAEVDPISVIVFCLGDEWFGLPTSILKEIVGIRPVHSVPHRQNGVLLGLTNVRGELLPCFSLKQVLGVEFTEPVVVGKAVNDQAATGRLLVMQREGGRAVCPVSVVHGIVHFLPQDIVAAPATIARAAVAYTRSALRWQEKLIGLLDDELLFKTVNRSLA
jgi:chemotaxis-related protein WspD